MQIVCRMSANKFSRVPFHVRALYSTATTTSNSNWPATTYYSHQPSSAQSTNPWQYFSTLKHHYHHVLFCIELRLGIEMARRCSVCFGTFALGFEFVRGLSSHGRRWFARLLWEREDGRNERCWRLTCTQSNWSFESSLHWYRSNQQGRRILCQNSYQIRNLGGMSQILLDHDRFGMTFTHPQYLL